MFYFIGVAYLVATIVVCILGMSKEYWLDVDSEYVMSFRRPGLYRVGQGMFSLLILAGAAFFTFAAFSQDTACIYVVPFILLIAILCAYMAGPQNVSIDLKTRVCHHTFGWMFHPRKESIALSEASCICVVTGSRSYYVNLMIGGGTKRNFMLAQPASLSDAKAFARKVADKLNLPLREASLGNGDLLKMS